MGFSQDRRSRQIHQKLGGYRRSKWLQNLGHGARVLCTLRARRPEKEARASSKLSPSNLANYLTAVSPRVTFKIIGKPAWTIYAAICPHQRPSKMWIVTGCFFRMHFHIKIVAACTPTSSAALRVRNLRRDLYTKKSLRFCGAPGRSMCPWAIYGANWAWARLKNH